MTWLVMYLVVGATVAILLTVDAARPMDTTSDLVGDGIWGIICGALWPLIAAGYLLGALAALVRGDP